MIVDLLPWCSGARNNQTYHPHVTIDTSSWHKSKRETISFHYLSLIQSKFCESLFPFASSTLKTQIFEGIEESPLLTIHNSYMWWLMKLWEESTSQCALNLLIDLGNFSFILVSYVNLLWDGWCDHQLICYYGISDNKMNQN